MSDGTTLRTIGIGGNVIFDEDVSTDPVGAFSGKIQGIKIYYGTRGTLGIPVSRRAPLPTANRHLFHILEQLYEETVLLRKAVVG